MQRCLILLFTFIVVTAAVAGGPEEELLNYGVDPAKLGRSPFQLNGKPATRHEIDTAIGNAVPDDSKKFRLVATGDPSERQRIVDAWQPMEAEMKARVALWCVPPDHWSLKDLETGKTVFRTGGLTFLAPDGKVLHRQPDFAGAEDFAAIRKAIRAYDAEKDPDLRKAAPAPIPTPTPIPIPAPLTPAPMPTNNVPMWIALFAIAAVNYYLNKRGF